MNRWRAHVVIVASLFGLNGRVHAHVGASVAVAKLDAPPDPAISHGDTANTIAPFTIATADQSFTITWNDGDVDPTGRFTFYYVDHQLNYQVLVTDIEAGLGTKIDDPVNVAGGYFAGCTCSGDMGVTCPPDVRDPNGNCSNSLVWNTQAVPTGTYWIAAVNKDPPFHVYNLSNSPIRVSHGTTPAPPALIIMRPDGYGTADTRYRLQWLAVGKAPFKFDLAYGVADTGTALQPTGDIAKSIVATDNGDGTFSYDWDVSTLMNNPYWVRVRATDADGTSTFSDSHFAVTVFHPTATPVTLPADMAMTKKSSGGCAVDGERGTGGFGIAAIALAGVFALAALARALVRKREE